MQRKRSTFGALAVSTGLIASLFVFGPSARAADSTGGVTQRKISSSGTVLFTGAALGSDGFANPEIRSQASDQAVTPYSGRVVNRDNSSNDGRTDGSNGGQGDGTSGNGGQGDATTVRLKKSFDGLNHRQQRLANGGNQFSSEPPDQGLCAGNGKVMEAVNDVTRVYDRDGTSLSPVVDLNTFFGYPAAISRSANPVTYGPFVTDPSCFFDTTTQRWFLDVLTLDVDPANGAFKGSNHIDLAVSNSGDPTGSWTIYRLAVQDDGSQGTPKHGCSLGPCLGDYPHLGADSNGIYVTTNEYSFNGPEFHGAQVYAISKRAIVSGAGSVSVVQYDTHGMDGGNSGFTLWPATSPASESSSAANGTEYLMSSNAADEAHGDGTKVGPRASTQLLVWALTNTNALNDQGIPVLSHTALPVNLYATPPASNQKPGNQPLRECLNDPTCATVLLGGKDPYGPEVLAPLDSNDTRMQQVTYSNGKLWGAVDTALTLGGVNKAGIEWFVVDPSIKNGTVRADLDQQHYLGLANNNIIYPAIGVNSDGQALMAFTVVGADYFPSAGYVHLGSDVSSSDIRIARKGAGPEDGFSNYNAYGTGTNRPRWGDYGATAVDGNSIWIASEYIGQTCTLTQFKKKPLGSCNGTRTVLANWDTRISHLEFGPSDGQSTTNTQP